MSKRARKSLSRSIMTAHLLKFGRATGADIDGHAGARDGAAAGVAVATIGSDEVIDDPGVLVSIRLL